MATTKAFTVVTDWTAVAQNTVSATADVGDFVDGFGGTIAIQAFLDTTTAHTGTEFIVQTRHGTLREDWHEWFRFVALIDASPDSDTLDDNPLAANSTTITFGDTTDFTIGAFRAIEDGTLINSEIITQIGVTTNTDIVISPGTVNEHAVNTPLFTAAISKEYLVSAEIAYVRLVVNNAYDADGSTLNYRFTMEEITAMA